MVRDGHWVLPHVAGEVYTDKPPLLFWLIAILSLPFGDVSSWTARAPSAIAAIVAVLLTHEIGRGLVGRRAARVGAIVLMSCYLFFDKARSAQIDMLLCALVLAALLCFLRAASSKVAWWGRAFWALCALAVLAKGPVGVLLPLGTVTAYVVIRREPGAFRRLAPASGPALFLLVVGLWVAGAQLAGLAEGYSILDVLQRHVWDRFSEGLHHRKPFYYFLHALPRGMFPWTLFLPGALLLAWREARKGSTGTVFLLCWFLFVFVFFSVSTEKRDLYILPLYPAVALMLGRLVDAVRDREIGGTGWLAVPVALTAAIFILAGAAGVAMNEAALVLLGGQEARELLLVWGDALAPVRRVLALMLAVGVLTAALLRHRGGARAFWSIAGGAAVTYLAAAILVLPAFDPHKSARGLCERIVAISEGMVPEGEPIGIYGLYRPAFALYTDNDRFRRLETGRDLRAFLQPPRTALLLSAAEDAAMLKRRKGLRFEVIEEGRVGHRRFVLLAVDPVESAPPMERAEPGPALAR